MCLSLIILLSSSIAISMAALPLPSYIEPCKADEKLNSCAVENGNAAWKKFIGGDPKYRLPLLDPLAVDKLGINSGTSRSIQLNLTLTDSKVHGLSQGSLLEANMDLANKQIEWTIMIPELKITGDYDVDGRILVLPIKGHGESDITLKDMKARIKFDYTLVNKKGLSFMKINKAGITYSTTRMYAKLSNLFNGNKLLADNMNRVIDENWEEFNAQLGPYIAESLAAVFKQIMSNILDLVPYDSIFVV